MSRATDKELREVDKRAFLTVTDAVSPHIAGLRAVYELGRSDVMVELLVTEDGCVRRSSPDERTKR